MTDIERFVDSMPDEPKTDDLETEIKRWVYEPFFDLEGIAIAGTSAYATVEDMAAIARHFAEWGMSHSFTHHEPDESLKQAVLHQMEDDGDVDDFVRRGLDEIVLKYAQLGAEWGRKQVLKEIYDGKYKVSDKITAAWLGQEPIPENIAQVVADHFDEML